jgi:diguanylate cyclase (GGDEF)-like protein
MSGQRVGDQVDFRLDLSRRSSRAGAVLVGSAVAVRVLALPVTPGVRAVDAVMAAIAISIGAILLRLPERLAPHRPAAEALGAVALAVVVAVGLRAAATQLSDFSVIAALSFTAILVGLNTDSSLLSVLSLRALASRTVEAPAVAACLVVVALFVALWLTSAPLASDIPSLIVALVVMLGIKLLAVGGVAQGRSQIDAETRRGHVYATLGRKLGVARDVTSVASAVLEACRETFPETSTGMVLISDPVDGLLKSPGVFLSSGGVAIGGPAYELAPGEGLGGTVFLSERAELWPTTLAASMAQASLREANRIRLRSSKLGFVRSAIGAPMRVDGVAIGVILLTSEHRENAWSDADAAIIEALADEAARAIERARRHEEEMGRALLDAVTGMATRTQLVTVIDKELARASRREATLALIMADIDGFQDLNDRRGHDAGNRVLEAFADVLRSILRREDSAARFGGDEFVCVLPGADRDQARAIAARIQQRFTAETSGDQMLGRSGATASVGIAMYPSDAQDVSGLIDFVSKDLTAAKSSQELTGRSRLRRRARDAAPG